ncbi:MSMEG_0570 family nitrogen starvation response protein [Rhodococcus sp. WB9]|uniref:MSMEG_0570 family nitrogen starvation response protein n=1 Tax=Rhodococcus sp. WB9 TaxID=2594007 RepID=UPI001185CC7F|nr:MSMEG_0570 family nitrogen starvation response protein [Rhodococcus sp. WB9]QDQ95285.1 MSMEG_0570 family nitrogen starvation response protein [Rhodococcus sp. WB9]
MPEMMFTVRWPDGSTQSCYSPSLVMHDHLVAGEDYTVADFLARTTTALTEASERVRAKFGMYCTSASEQMQELERAGRTLDPQSLVRVLEMNPASLPGES